MSTTADSAASDREPMLSERLAEYFRSNDLTRISALSPYAACIVPILEALGWRPYSRDLIDTLPHFADHFDLVDLLNVLVTLGYQSDPKNLRLDRVSPSLLPCLFIGNDEQLWVVTERTDTEIAYFDAHRQERVRAPLERVSGMAYVFTSHKDHEETAVVASGPGGWFGQLLLRFRTVLWHLLGMSFLIHCIAIAVPLYIMSVYDNVIGARSLQSLPYFAAGITIALVAELLLRYLRARTLGLVAGRMDYLVGVETFRHLMFLPPSMTERASPAVQLARLKQFDTIRDFFAGPTAMAILDLPFVVLFLILMGILSGPIALVPLAVLIAYTLLGMIYLPALNRHVAAAGRARTTRQRRLLDTFSGMRELKALGAESLWLNTCREVFSSSIMEGFKTAKGHVIINAIAQTLQTVAGVAVLGLGAHAVMAGDISVGVLIAVMTLLWRILGPLQTLFLTYVKFDQVAQVIRQINQLMRLETEHRSARSALLIPRIRGTIRFNRVSFRYAPNQDPALLGVSFKVEPGEFVAVMGGNGCGKSTILKLIIGMYHPQAGTVSIDDLDLRQFNATDLRRVIAYAPQYPSLFYGTIEQNLRMSDPGASRSQIEHAAAQAGILDIVMNDMPHGFDTRIGDRSTDRLPSGFIYGLCLARAYMRDTPILLLDEPSSSLDQEADGRFVDQVRQLHGTRTLVMVSHRPSHIRLADRVVVLDNGLMTGVGPPDRLLAEYIKAKT